MKTLLMTAAATAALSTAAFAEMSIDTLPAGNEWSQEQLSNYITGLDEAGFQKLDTDQNNMVDRQELQAAMSAGMVTDNTEATAQAAASIDFDKLPAGNEWSQEQLANYFPGLDEATFNRIDTDQNNMADRQELKAAAAKGMMEMGDATQSYTFSFDALPAGNEWDQETLADFIPGLDDATFEKIDTDGDDMASRTEISAAIKDGLVVAKM